MNINNISTNFLKLSQQLNFDREEEEAPEPFVWTDERTSLDVESENEYWSKNDVVYNLDLLKIREPKHSEIPYNFSFDLEYLKAPKLTREFLEQIEKNHIYDKELGLQKAIKDKDDHKQKILQNQIDSLKENFNYRIKEILEISNQLSIEYDKLKYNYLKAKTYLATSKEENKIYSSSIEFIKDIPNLLKIQLFRILPLKYLVSKRAIFLNKFIIKSKFLGGIYNSLRSRLDDVEDINSNFESKELQIKQYILNAENFVEEYLSDEDNLKFLNYIDATRPDIVASLHDQIKHVSYAYNSPEDLVRELWNKFKRNSFEIVTDARKILENDFLENNKLYKEIYDLLKEIIDDFFQKLNFYKIKYRVDGNVATIYINHESLQFLLKEFQINLQSIIDFSDKNKQSLLFYFYPDIHKIEQKIIKNRIDINNRDSLKQHLNEKFYDNIKSRISHDISTNFSSSEIEASEIEKLIYHGGGFDKISILRALKTLFPGINKSELLATEKEIYKLQVSKNKVFLMLNEILMNVKLTNVFSEILLKENKLNHKYIIDLINKHSNYIKQIERLRYHIPREIKDNEADIIKYAVRSYNTIDVDLENLKEILQMFHNEANNLSKTVYLKILKNPNSVNFTKSADIKKIISFYTKFKSSGGIKFLQFNKKDIDHLIKLGAIKKTFFDNIKQVVDFFENSGKISLKLSPNLITALNTAETDLQFLSDAETYKKYFNLVQPKNKNIYEVNYQINNKLRFRALKEKDPRHLRIGIETDCCQRVGGAAETCVVDSFINAYAGILILEIKEEESWQLLCQSYFHYVPKDNGFILDNIESSDLAKNISNQELAKYYNLLAKYAIANGFNYLLAGKGYSDINVDFFKTDSRPQDPRTFNDDVDVNYSDYKPDDGMDLSIMNYINYA